MERCPKCFKLFCATGARAGTSGTPRPRTLERDQTWRAGAAGPGARAPQCPMEGFRVSEAL